LKNKSKIFKCFFRKLRSEENSFDFLVDRMIPLIKQMYPTKIKKVESKYNQFIKQTKNKDLKQFLQIYNNGLDFPYYLLNQHSYRQRRQCLLRSGDKFLWIYWAYLKDFSTLFRLSRDYFRDKTLYHELLCKKHKTDEKFCDGTLSNCTKYKRFKNIPNKDFITPEFIVKDFFNFEILNLELKKQFDRDMYFLCEYFDYIEVGFIKDNDNEKRHNLTFTEELILLFLEKILHYLDPGILKLDQFDEITPLKIKLVKYNEKELCLEVIWQNKIAELFRIHKFQEQLIGDNYTELFSRVFFTKKEFIIDKASKLPSNFEIKKYIERLGFCDILEELFIKVVDSSKVILKTKSITFSELEKAKSIQLLAYINTLEFIGWKDELLKYIKPISHVADDL